MTPSEILRENPSVYQLPNLTYIYIHFIPVFLPIHLSHSSKWQVCQRTCLVMVAVMTRVLSCLRLHFSQERTGGILI